MFSRILIGNVRRFVSVPSQEVYNNLLFFLQKDLKASVESEEETLLIKAKLKVITKALGFTVRIRIIPEGEASTIELSLSYKGFKILVFALLIVAVSLGVTFFSTVPPFIGITLLFLLIHYPSSVSNTFLKSMNNFLVLLERDYDQKLLLEDRKRWQADFRRTNDLYNRLMDKHVKVWGDAHILEYKISEYVKTGLTREEAIRKVSEEEGIF